MFFGEDRIPKFRRMILSDTVEKRVEALKPIGEFQKTDFKRSVGRNWIENFRTKTLWDKRLDEG